MTDSEKLSSRSSRFSAGNGRFSVTAHSLDLLERQKRNDERMATISNPPQAPCPYERPIASLYPGPLRYDDAGLVFVMRPTPPPPSARNPRFARDWIAALYGQATPDNPRLSARPTARVLFGSLDDADSPRPVGLIDQTSNPLIRPRARRKKVYHRRPVRAPDDPNESARRKKKDDAIDDIIRQLDEAQSDEEAEPGPRDDENVDAAVDDDQRPAPDGDAGAPYDDHEGSEADDGHEGPEPPADDRDSTADGEDDVRAAIGEAVEAFGDIGGDEGQAGGREEEEGREDDEPNETSVEEEEGFSGDGHDVGALGDVIGNALKDREDEQETFDGGGETLDDVMGSALKDREDEQETFDGGRETLDDVMGSALKDRENEQETVDGGGGTLGDVMGNALKDRENEQETFDGGPNAPAAEEERVDRGGSEDDGSGLLGDVIGRAETGSDAGSEEALGDVIGGGLKAPADEQDANDRGGNEGDEAGDSLGEIVGSGHVERGYEDARDGVVGGAPSSSATAGRSEALSNLLGDEFGLGQEGDRESGPADHSGGALGGGAALMGDDEAASDRV
jgi:hypothetical protein